MIETLLRPLRRRDYFLLSALLAALYVLGLLGLDFLLGIGPFWAFPRGIMGGADKDMATSTADNLAFAIDAWNWPRLFHTTLINAPEGANIAQTDSIPLLALFTRLVFRLTGTVWNPVGAFVAGAFLLNGLGMSALLRTLGHRSMLAAALGTGAGLLMPALLWRFGHISLTSHFLIVAALVLYLLGRRPDRDPHRISLAFTALVCISLLVTPYLFAMVLPIMVAHIAQGLVDRRLRKRHVVWTFAGLVPAMLAIMYASGYVGGANIGPGHGFGVYSMNLLSPFWPQSSSLFGLSGNYYLTRGVIGGTAGQYEGYNYLGAGLLVALLLALPTASRTLPDTLRRHRMVAILMVAFTLFALSNNLYLGDILLLNLPLPEGAISNLFNQFRSSGRFFWPVAYLLAGFAIHRLLMWRNTRRAVIAAAAVLGLQFFDTLGLQSRIHAVVHNPLSPPLSETTLHELLVDKRAIEVFPTMHCQSWTAPEQFVNAQLIMAAARAGIASNDVHVARSESIDCGKVMTLPEVLRTDTLYVVNRRNAPTIAAGLHDRVVDCRTLGDFEFCSGRDAEH